MLSARSPFAWPASPVSPELRRRGRSEGGGDTSRGRRMSDTAPFPCSGRACRLCTSAASVGLPPCWRWVMGFHREDWPSAKLEVLAHLCDVASLSIIMPERKEATRPAPTPVRTSRFEAPPRPSRESCARWAHECADARSLVDVIRDLERLAEVHRDDLARHFFETCTLNEARLTI